MILLATLAIIINTSVVVCGAAYFRDTGPCRESDKTLVATVSALSAMFVVVQLAGWWLRPEDMQGVPVLPLLYGFTMASSVVHLALIRSLLHRTRSQCTP